MTWALLLIPLILLAAPLGLRAGLLAQRRGRYPLREFPDFLSDEECAHLISRAEPLLRKSSAIMQGRTGLYDVGRQSATALLDQAGDPRLHLLSRDPSPDPHRSRKER